MRRVSFDRFGEPAEVLRVVDVPTPTPGPRQVLVRVHKRPIHPADLMTVRGLYGERPPLPASLGSEAVGTIERLGPEVSGLVPGQRVALVGAVGGTWSDETLAYAATLVPVPDAVACQMFVNPITAALLLDMVPAGGWAVQTAAGSAVGQLMIQLARRRGINLVNVVRRRAGIDELSPLGAEHVVATENADWTDQVRAAVGGEPIAVAFDAVAGPLAVALAGLLTPGGTFVVYGALSGEPVGIAPGDLIFRKVTVRGFWLADWFRTAPETERNRVIQEAVELVIQGRLHFPVAAEYDLTDIAEAVRRAESVGRTGKVLLSS